MIRGQLISTMAHLIQDSDVSCNSLLSARHGAMRSMETVGDRVRKRREALGIQVNELAKAVGLKPSAISELESGRTKTSKSLHRIATALDCTVEYLAGDDKSPPVKKLYGPLDVELLTECIEELEKQLAGRSLPPSSKAETIASLYEAESKVGRAAILRLVKRIA